MIPPLQLKSETHKRTRYAGLLAALFLVCTIGAAQCIPSSQSPRIERFASVKELSGQGKVGSELRLEENGNQVVATLRDYMGGDQLLETQLRGGLVETAGLCKVQLLGKNKQGQLEIDGEIEITRFLGTVTRQLGKKSSSHIISLRRQLPFHAPDVG